MMHPRAVTVVHEQKDGTLMSKKLEQDLRHAGVRKKRARRVAKAADRARDGDRAAREFVEQNSAALRASVSAVVSHAKLSRPTKKAAAKKPPAKKPPAKRTATKRAPGRRPTDTATA
jgi:hypothetical protein